MSMSGVYCAGLTKRYMGNKPPTIAVSELDLEVEHGQFTVLLGPSGCGKTTTLRCIAGLETPDRGEIRFGDRTVFDALRGVDVPPNKRNMGMVFQSYALWPHLTVRKNLDYPLRAMHLRGRGAADRISELARLVDCDDLLDRYPHQLSGGQQQRVALARGLVARPDLVLFDEPLSNLDARLRDVVRAKIHELHTQLRFTAVYVTHDQSEALALGDRLAIMGTAVIEQYDTPERIFSSPASEYVAGFVGMSNRLVLTYSEGMWTSGGRAIRGQPPAIAPQIAPVAARVRPEDVLVVPADARALPDATNVWATVVDVAFGGRHLDVVVDAGDRLHARVSIGDGCDWARRLAPGDVVAAAFRSVDARFFDQNGQPLLPHAKGGPIAISTMDTAPA